MTQKFTSNVVVGLEIHTQLNTNTKLFCGCATSGSEEPNTRTCEVCLGMPGAKPVLNKKAVEYALKLCVALDCSLAKDLVFSRKSYFYPDLAKNYQITQYEMPLGMNGKLKLSDGKEIGIQRIHMEEDPASLVHPSGTHESKYVLVDYNRSGNPLCEIVTKPELSSAEEARDFMKQLTRVLNYLGVFDIDTCIIKADANVSIKESGYTRVEIKNITGFKEIERALFYEIERQKKMVEDGKEIKIETHAWNADKGVTQLLRSKESEDDYGYIIDPNLVNIEITDEMIKSARSDMPELPEEKAARYVHEFDIDKGDAIVICTDLKLASLFEKVIDEIEPVVAAKWFRKELLRVMNYNDIDSDALTINEIHIIDLLKLLVDKKISDRVGQKILEKIVVKPQMPTELVEKEGLEKVSDSGELEKHCKEAIEKNKNVVEEYKSGKVEALNFLVGQVMRATRGKADAKEVKQLLIKIVK
jgi:aspartyl-tRNA(Asn)/glutamyl-tRNA(Gln) amidotransferase subunit B